MNNYGWFFNVSRQGVWVMLNGRMFSVYRSTLTNRWVISSWANWWRKNKVTYKQYAAAYKESKND